MGRVEKDRGPALNSAREGSQASVRAGRRTLTLLR
jgi:hypothetical protein